MKTLILILTAFLISASSYSQETALDESYNILQVYLSNDSSYFEYGAKDIDTTKDIDKSAIKKGFSALRNKLNNKYPYTLQIWVLYNTLPIKINKIDSESWEINGIYFTSLNNALKFAESITIAAHQYADYY